ncbi:MAG TPA: glycosyltransferase family 39 protein [Solirubrobacterales bacterium]|nr:glycosyltransferase family 39 protein [Solirubrobacterales bacterium]
MEVASLPRTGAAEPRAGRRRSFREWAGERSRAFWIVAGLTVLAAVLRFATLGVQSYHHDEIVTASRVLRDGFGHAMNAVWFSESTPPVYYAVAWAWTQLAGTHEYGLRAVSAAAGVATVPVAYLIARELRGRRAGLWAAALVAVNPMMLWYSQEARAYALVALFGALSALYWLRAERRGGRRDFVWWGIWSGLAIATHYFVAFPILAEAVMLLRRRGLRASLVGMAILAGCAIAVAPVAIHQMSLGHAEWIGNFSLGHRLGETATTFVTGETGDIIARPERPWLAFVPLALSLGALALLLRRRAGRERRAAGRALLLVAAGIGIPAALALVAASKDFVLARNLIPALVPLLAAIGIAVSSPASRRLGAAVGALLFAYSLGFCILASADEQFQRPNWSAVAERMGEPRGPRATVTWTLGEAPLRYYLSTGAIQVRASERYDWLVKEVDFVSDGSAPAPPRHLLGPGFHQVADEDTGRLVIRRYRFQQPGLAPLRLRLLRQARLDFRSNGVLLDGVGPQ